MLYSKSRVFTAYAIALVATTASATAKPGSLDKTLNSTGFFKSGTNTQESLIAVAMMSDGRIVATGYSTGSGSGDILVRRFKSDGSPDSTFSGNGSVIKNLGTVAGVNTYDLGTGVAVQPDGKILVTGYTNEGGTKDENIFVVRYNEDGSPDLSFGDGGLVISDFHGNDRASSIVVLGNGKILVGGTTGAGSGKNDFCVTRYESDGSYDSSFTANGQALDVFGYDTLRAMAVQEDGKIVLVGDADIANLDFAVVRLSVDGKPDETFDGDGYLTIPSAGNSSARSVQIQPDGKILVGGTISESSGGGRRDFGLVRLTATGALDPSFSGDGLHTESLGQDGGLASVVLQNDGRILLIGVTNYGVAPDMAMMRFTSTGSLDKTFGVNGKVITDFGGYDLVSGAVAQPDGRVVAVGSSDGGSLLARCNMVIKTDAIVGTRTIAAKGGNIYNSTGAGQMLNLPVKRNGGKELSYVKIQNDGDSEEVFTIKGTSGNNALQIRYLVGGLNVTSQVTKGVFQTSSLAPGETFSLKVVITAKTKKPKISREFAVVGRSLTDPSNRDTVLIKAKSK